MNPLNRGSTEKTAPIRLLGMALLASMLYSHAGLSYERPNQLAVIESDQIQQADTGITPAIFREQYLAAGEPRIVLFWDIAFDDQTEMHGGGLELEQQVNYGQGYINSRERLGAASQDDPSRSWSGMARSESAAIESAFISALTGAGIQLVDRGTVIRTTHAGPDRTEENRKLIETDAIQSHADLLIEVITIPDQQNSHSYGFKVSCRNLETGVNLLAFYSNEEPEKQAPRGGYVATDRGFEWYQPAQAPTSPDEYGFALANSVLNQLGPRIDPNN